MRRLLSVVVLLAVAAALPGAAQAKRTYLYYVCKYNICSVDSQGHHRFKETTDGTENHRYTSPSVSRDGRKLGLIYGNDAQVLDFKKDKFIDLKIFTSLLAAITADGRNVAVINEQEESQGSLVPWLVSIRSNGSDYRNESREAHTLGWFGHRLLRDGSSKTHEQCRNGTGDCRAQSICIVRSDGTCGRNIADAPHHNLYDPAVSPNGKLVAVTSGRTQTFLTGGRIALYRTSNGKFVRNLTSKFSVDHFPTWSPNGKTIAFEQSGAIYTVPARGHHKPHRIVKSGQHPTWGR